MKILEVERCRRGYGSIVTRNLFSPDNNADYYWGSSNGNSDHPAAGRIMVWLDSELRQSPPVTSSCFFGVSLPSRRNSRGCHVNGWSCCWNSCLGPSGGRPLMVASTSSKLEGWDKEGSCGGEGEQRSSTSVDNLTPHRRCGLGKMRSERRRSATSG